MLSKQGSEGKTFKISPSRGILSSAHLQGITLIAQKPETTDNWPQQPQRHVLAIITWGLLHPKWHGRSSEMSVPGCSRLLMGPPRPCCVCEQGCFPVTALQVLCLFFSLSMALGYPIKDRVLPLCWSSQRFQMQVSTFRSRSLEILVLGISLHVGFGKVLTSENWKEI